MPEVRLDNLEAEMKRKKVTRHEITQDCNILAVFIKKQKYPLKILGLCSIIFTICLLYVLCRFSPHKIAASVSMKYFVTFAVLVLQHA